MRPIALLIIFILATGCSSRKAEGNDAEQAVAQAPLQEEAQATPEQTQPGSARAERDAWTEKALLSQPRMAELKAKADPAMGEPGSTDWRAAQGVEGLDSLTAQSPVELLEATSEALHFRSALGVDVWEQTMRLFQDDDESAQGILMSWGAKDDSLAGADYLVKMKLDGEDWRVESVEERIHCWRGVGESGLCM